MATSGTAASDVTPLQPPIRAWRVVEPARETQLTDARLQLHHAAQLVASFGIAFVEHRADDSHTSMEWLPALDALASNPAGADRARLAVRPRDLTLLLLADGSAPRTFALHAKSVADAAEWVRRNVAADGLPADAYTLEKNYTIPPHHVGSGRMFDARAVADLAQLDHWFSNAAMLLEELVATTPNASPARCWPHHFDIATLLEIAPGKTVGAGLEPGDQYYGEPYWYCNLYPAPKAGVDLPPLDGGGIWHTREWTGAVLPASRMLAATQAEQCARFVQSAMDACRVLLQA